MDSSPLRPLSPQHHKVRYTTATSDNALCFTFMSYGKEAHIVVVNTMIAHKESSEQASIDQTDFIHAFCVEHELESEIRISSKPTSLSQQNRLVKAKQMRIGAEIIYYSCLLADRSADDEELDNGEEFNSEDEYSSEEELPSGTSQ